MMFLRTLFVFVLLTSALFAQEVPDFIQANVSDVQYPGAVHSIYGWAAEPPHENPSRPDDDNEIDDATQTYWLGQPFSPPLNVNSQADLDIDCLDGESDLIVIQVMIDGKPDIVAQHVGDDGTINWNGVAGENNQQHDHWPNAFGIITLNDFNSNQDKIVVRGHTVKYGGQFIPGGESELEANLRTDQFGTLLPVPTIRVYSQQGAGGGAHDEDTLGFIQFVNPTKRIPDPNSGFTTIQENVGVCRTIAEFEELTEFYQQVEDLYGGDDQVDQAWVEFLLLLESFGLDPAELTDEQLDFLFEILG
jgi:hypothetical protein